MNADELKDYRKILEKEYTDKDLEIDSTLSYISIGALGFFITINDKFLKLKEAHFKTLIIVSLILIFTSFILLLVRKSRTMHYANKMMRYFDKMKPDTDNIDVGLSELWEESHKELSYIRAFVYLSLLIGIGLQILLLLLNSY